MITGRFCSSKLPEMTIGSSSATASDFAGGEFWACSGKVRNATAKRMALNLEVISAFIWKRKCIRAGNVLIE